MADEDRLKWDGRYAAFSAPGPPAAWLVHSLDQVSFAGRALELAAGTGGNAIELAKRGWNVTAVDISPVGLDIGRRSAPSSSIDWCVLDLESGTPPGSFQLMSAFYFLDRVRLPQLANDCLAPGGWLIAQTFHLGHPQRGRSRFALKLGEWKELFADFEILELVEDQQESAIFARKPVS